jgi:hypothetical protein
MTDVKVFDPAMCCSTGVCGPAADRELARVAADLDWLASTGVSVERFNLSHQPEAFVAHGEVTEALRERGDSALPVVLVDGRKVMEGAYPSREQLARWAAPDPPVAVATADAGGAASCGCGDGGCC